MNIRNTSLLTAKGFCMGMADLVPGVSGGTIAFITGIYAHLLEAIKSFDADWIMSVIKFDIKGALAKPHFAFLIPLLIGIAGALAFFTRVVPLQVLIRDYPEMVYGLFFGLILASIVILLREIGKFGVKELVVTFAGTALGLAIVNIVPVDTPDASWFIFLSGAIAICAMILPGISGSFILLILKKYTFIIGAVAALDFTVLLPFALGAVTGLLAFTRFLVWWLHHYYKLTLLVINGILMGALWIIWPFQARVYETIGHKNVMISTTPVWPEQLDMIFTYSLLLMALGFIAVMLIHFIALRKPPAE